LSLKFHEIAEGGHRILNPLTEDKLMLVGEICHLKRGMRQLDLCCGKAEMLCQWSKRWGISGVGVDISSVFITAARERAHELFVHDRLKLVEGDARNYPVETHGFDVISCIGATWIGGGLVGTLNLMQQSLKPGGLLLVGEPYWKSPPPDVVYTAMQVGKDDFTSLAGTQDRIESCGLELVEMVLSNEDSWDRYVAAQWWTIDDWLRRNPDDPDISELRAWNARWKHVYLEYERAYFGWGIFIMRVK
jgi:SAM-dependent methyltransferase